jgi:hypothetical protein
LTAPDAWVLSLWRALSRIVVPVLRPAGPVLTIVMAYGVTSTTLLLAVGTNPAAASATEKLERRSGAEGIADPVR